MRPAAVGAEARGAGRGTGSLAGWYRYWYEYCGGIMDEVREGQSVCMRVPQGAGI